MPDVDLAVILADGEYLRRVGDDLTGENPPGGLMATIPLTSSAWGSTTYAQIATVGFSGLTGHKYQAVGHAQIGMSGADDIGNVAVRDGATTVCGPGTSILAGSYASLPLSGLIVVNTARTVTVSVWIAVSFGSGSMQVLGGNLTVTDLGQ